MNEFIKRNLVMIVMIPVIGGIHYGWMKMNDQADRKELPIVSVRSPSIIYSLEPVIHLHSRPSDVQIDGQTNHGSHAAGQHTTASDQQLRVVAPRIIATV